MSETALKSFSAFRQLFKVPCQDINPSGYNSSYYFIVHGLSSPFNELAYPMSTAHSLVLILYNSLIKSQFNHCSLMYCGKDVNNDFSRTHKRALRILHNDYSSTFEELLHKSNKCTIHNRNLQKLLLEVYKSTAKLNPSFIWDFFHEKTNQYNLRQKIY